ncbi:MAG TPA: hypothetical protein PKD95_04515 [Candidatus Paceibacterota bacterium]|nr:hypothetical protein [Candidatus Paceibacterota bacterium]
MNTIMKNVQIRTVAEVQKFLEGNQSINCTLESREDKYNSVVFSAFHYL